MVLDPHLLTKIFKLVIVKLSSVVKDNHPRDPKLTNDVLLDGVLHFGLCDDC